jgi:hypothetical protein
MIWRSQKSFSLLRVLVYTNCKPVRCTGKLLKIKYKLILIHFTSFVEGQGLAINQFVARLLQPTTWQFIRPSRCII